MKIELKAIKYSEFASHETYCYQAKLYVNGKPFAFVENDGHGGADNVYPLNNLPVEDLPAWRENLAVIEAWLLQTHRTDLECCCTDLVTQWLMEKDAKRILRKIAYLKDDGDVYTIRKAKPTAENLAKLQQCTWWKPSYVLLNTLPKHEAIARIIKAMDYDTSNA